METKMLWSQTLELLMEEEYQWLKDAVATIAHALKEGDRNGFQGWLEELVSLNAIKSTPDIRFTKTRDYYAAQFVSEGDELLELHVAILQQFLKLHRPTCEFTINWAKTEPKFGGGCVIISPTTMESIDSEKWLYERIHERLYDRPHEG